MPVNLERLIWNTKLELGITHESVSDLDPVQVYEDVKELLQRLIVVPGKDTLSVQAQDNATNLFQIMVRSTLASKLVVKEHRLSKVAWDTIIDQVEIQFNRAIVCPAEMVGVIAAQSIGEPATQMTLVRFLTFSHFSALNPSCSVKIDILIMFVRFNFMYLNITLQFFAQLVFIFPRLQLVSSQNTFHFAGVSAKNVTLGVPRLKEIISCRKRLKTPCITVHLHEKNDQEYANAVMAKLECTYLRAITEKTAIIFDPLWQNEEGEIQTCIPQDQEFVAACYELEEIDVNSLSPWLLRITLNKTEMALQQIELKDVATKMQEEYDTSQLHLIKNFDIAEEVVIRLRLVSSNSRNGDTDDEPLKLRMYEDTMLDSLKLKGVEGIVKVYTRKDKIPVYNPETWAEDMPAESNTNLLDTDGTALLEVLSIPEVDHQRTISNDVIEILQVLGIEGARAALVNEVRNVIAFDGNYVNYRHLAILVDIMTFRGYLMPIDRHGINRVDTGPLLRCSFEETCEILFDAAAFAEKDDLNGVTENIMLGQMTPCGSGLIDLFLDDEVLKEAREFDSDDDDGSASSSSDDLELMQTPNDPDFNPIMTPIDDDPSSPGGGASPLAMSPNAEMMSPYASPEQIG